MIFQIALQVLLVISEFAINHAGQLPTLKRVTRIVGGQLTEIEKVPYIVNIRKNGLFECGGSLLTSKCVLTAAHCVKNGVPADFVIRAGVTYLNDFYNSRRVENIFIPITYNNKTLEHDIAIFQLKSNIKGKMMETITLSDVEPETGDFVKVTGWGLINETASHPSVQMRTVQLRVMQQQLCRTLYMDYRNVSETMFCASVPGFKDACSADSGGPAVMDGQLVGIVSWGRGQECGRSTSPGVYVNIMKMRPWIENIVQNYCY